MTKRGPRDIERCTFCGKDRRKVLSLIAGPPGIYICNECVELCNTLLLEELKPKNSDGAAPPAAVSLEAGKVPHPGEIHRHLDEFVVGQEHAKRVLSVSVYQHYQRILNPRSENDIVLEKSNVLLIGPTGSGKTLLARTLARYLQVPFAISDATTLTEAGYVGEDVENIVLRLVQSANYDIELAERGIIYIDEIDKIARTTQNVSITRDVSGEGVQQGLLKILEGTVANIPPQGGRKHPEQSYLSVNTSNILFVVGGTFSDIDGIISRRIGKQGIGYHADAVLPESDEERGRLLRQIESGDLVQFGLIPEFVGRLPVMGILDPLSAEDFTRILKEPKNAIVRQYQRLFELEGCQLEFEDEALSLIAQDAKQRSTGVRALRSILEELMLDVMYTLPDLPPARYTVTAAFVRKEAPMPREELPPAPASEPTPGPSKSEKKKADDAEHREAG